MDLKYRNTWETSIQSVSLDKAQTLSAFSSDRRCVVGLSRYKSTSSRRNVCKSTVALRKNRYRQADRIWELWDTWELYKQENIEVQSM